VNKITFCIIALTGLSSSALADFDDDSQLHAGCEAQSHDCDDGRRAVQSGKVQARGWVDKRPAVITSHFNDGQSASRDVPRGYAAGTTDPDSDDDGVPDVNIHDSVGTKGGKALADVVTANSSGGAGDLTDVFPPRTATAKPDSNRRAGQPQTGNALKGLPIREGGKTISPNSISAEQSAQKVDAGNAFNAVADSEYATGLHGGDAQREKSDIKGRIPPRRKNSDQDAIAPSGKPLPGTDISESQASGGKKPE